MACEQNRAAQKEISGGTFGAADSAPDHWLERIREKQALATLCAMPGLVGGALTTMMQDKVASQDRQSDSKEAGAKRATPSSGEDSHSLQELQRIKQRYEKESAGAVEACLTRSRCCRSAHASLCQEPTSRCREVRTINTTIHSFIQGARLPLKFYLSVSYIYHFSELPLHKRCSK